MSLFARIRGIFRRKEVKVISLTWSKPFYLFGGHRIFEMDPLGNIAHLPFDSDRVQHRSNNHYCIRMKKGYSYTTALNESNARRQFAKQGFDLLKNAITR